jgi:hypothetical protein
MTWQYGLILIFIIAAGTYVLWSTIRAWTGSKSGCGSGCGKCAVPIEEEKPGRVSLL